MALVSFMSTADYFPSMFKSGLIMLKTFLLSAVDSGHDVLHGGLVYENAY